MERRRGDESSIVGISGLDEGSLGAPTAVIQIKIQKSRELVHGQSGNNILGKGNCKCKGHEMEGLLVFSRTRYEAQ